MIEENCAKEIYKSAMQAITTLSSILEMTAGKCSTKEYEKIKKGIGLSIGKIQTDILDIICLEYPALDDLR